MINNFQEIFITKNSATVEKLWQNKLGLILCFLLSQRIIVNFRKQRSCGIYF